MLTLEETIKKIKSGEISLKEVREQGLLLSVTSRIKFIKQPRGGYVSPKQFEIYDLKNAEETQLNSTENIAPSLVGTAVDYLTRFMTGSDAFEAFHISFLGAQRLRDESRFTHYLSSIKGLDNESIVAALRLVGYDCVFRVGPEVYRPVEDILPNQETIDNVRIMVNRSQLFFHDYGPKILDGLTFKGGYTGYIATGDGDFLTSDTLWDFKVSKQGLKSDQTLQLLIYWRMGLHSENKNYYKPLKYLGIFNPRLNLIYRLAVEKIDTAVIHEVEQNVIGY